MVLAEPIPKDLAEKWCLSGGRKKDLRRARWLAHRWKRSGVVCVHTHFLGFSTAVAAVACRIAGIPLLVTVHARGIFVPGPLMDLSIEGATSLIAISKRTALAIESQTGRSSMVLPVPIARTPRAPSTTGTPHILTVGRPVAKKGYPTLRSAIERVNKPIRWTVVGANEDQIGGPMAGLQALGSVPFQVIESVYQEGVDVFALACCTAPDGDVDGVPVAILEAMARGVAVVSTNVGAIAEVLTHNETGILVPPRDPAALAVAINRLVEDHQFRQSLGRNGQAHVRNTRSVSKHVCSLFEHMGTLARLHHRTKKNLG